MQYMDVSKHRGYSSSEKIFNLFKDATEMKQLKVGQKFVRAELAQDGYTLFEIMGLQCAYIRAGQDGLDKLCSAKEVCPEDEENQTAVFQQYMS